MKFLCVIALVFSCLAHANYEQNVVQVITDLNQPPVCGKNCLSFKSITVAPQASDNTHIECDDVDDTDAITDEDSALDGDGGCTIIHSHTKLSIQSE